jgi:hypothetical protein
MISGDHRTVFQSASEHRLASEDIGAKDSSINTRRRLITWSTSRRPCAVT